MPTPTRNGGDVASLRNKNGRKQPEALADSGIHGDLTTGSVRQMSIEVIQSKNGRYLGVIQKTKVLTACGTWLVMSRNGPAPLINRGIPLFAEEISAISAPMWPVVSRISVA